MVIRFAEWLSPTANKGQFPSLAARKFSFFLKAINFLKILKKLFLKKVSLAEHEAEPRTNAKAPLLPPCFKKTKLTSAFWTESIVSQGRNNRALSPPSQSFYAFCRFGRGNFAQGQRFCRYPHNFVSANRDLSSHPPSRKPGRRS